MTFHFKILICGMVSTAFNLAVFLLFVLIIYSCNEEDLVSGVKERGQTIAIFNHTGHIVQNGSDRCGMGITVRFVLSSSSEEREYIFAPDTFRSVSLKIDVGDVMNIKVYEVVPGDDILLIEKDKNFVPGSESSLDLPTIILCPKDELEILGF